MLHILNGESTAGTLGQSSIPGERLSFRDALINGPTPSEMRGQEWRRVRAEHLSAAYAVDLHECEQDLLEQEEKLATFAEHKEVVLWFEHDLFCQTNLLYVLDWFAHRNLGETRLSLISIGEFPELPNFRGLGELNVEQLASLFEIRHEVSVTEMKLATAAWQAYCSPDPTHVEELLATDTSTLPFLKRALQLHLARFPSLRNGLGYIENVGLKLISDGFKSFIDLFPKFADLEPTYGLGDSQFLLALRQMSNARKPLLAVKNGNSWGGQLTLEKVREAAFEITEAGEAVLRSKADFVAMNGIDLWLGGVHLSDKVPMWRWNEAAQKIVQG
jgi:hypothetical protein